MYLYATLKVIFFLMIAYIGKPDLFKRMRIWILPAVLFWIVDVATSYFQYNGGLNPIVGTLMTTPTIVIFFMALFQYSPLKSYVFSIILTMLTLLPELVFAIPVAILTRGFGTEERMDQTLSIFSYMPSYVVVYLIRQQIKGIFIWFESCTDEFIIGLLVICLNSNWFMVAINSTLIDQETYASEAQMLYIILIGTVIINILPASLIYQSIRKSSQQTKSHNITIAKGMLSDYLSQVHDLKNIAHVLNIPQTKDSLKEVSVLEKMIELKKSRARKEDILVYMSPDNRSIIDHSLDAGHLFFNSLDCSIIAGIFMDNAIEHIRSNTQLDRTIHIKWQPEFHTFAISNPITAEGIKFLSEHAKGKSTKNETLLSGYGLANAKELARQSHVKIDSQVTEHEVTFTISYV